MRGFRIASYVAAATAILLAAPAWAEIGVTSVTAGDPLGQPPAEPERVLRVGIDVLANERVTTKADDRAHLVFLDGTALTVGPNSVVVLDKFVYDADLKTGQMSLSAAKGVFRLVGGNISKGSAITIKTPSATIGIRGGIINFEVADNGSTKATFIYGESMTVTSQGSTRTATRNGSEIRIDVGRPPSTPTIVPPGGGASTAAFEKPSTVALVNQAVVTTAQTQTRPAAVTAVTPVAAVAAVTPVAVATSATPVSLSQIDAALNNSELTKDNSKRTRGELAEEDRRHGIHREGAGKSVVVMRTTGPTIMAVLKPVTTAPKVVAQKTSKATSHTENNNRGRGH